MENPAPKEGERTTRLILIILGATIYTLTIFKVGMAVGYYKANYSYRWSENYHRNFGGPRGGFFSSGTMPMMDRNYRNPHGAFGKIINISLPTITIQNPDEAEKSISISRDTSIRRFQEIVTSTDLRLDDNIVVIGEPDEQGRVSAKLIRIIPEGRTNLAPSSTK